MIGGIDQQIQQKVDAYRGNPQQLMQRYQQNQELIDLLALQKLKSEKDAAARQMQMQMQGNPQTIKDQREAEMLQRTKDDMVQQTSGIMQQRQQQQQKNMQRTANQGLPQLPAGNMQRMAGGGIVSFAEGGDVKAKVEEALQTGASLADIEMILRNDPEALAYLRSRIQEAQKAEIPYGEEFGPRESSDRAISLASMGDRPAEGMRVPSRAPEIDTTDIMSLLGPTDTKRAEPPTARMLEREPSEPSMGERPAEAMGTSMGRSSAPTSVPSRAPMIDTTDLASLLGPKETARPEVDERKPSMQRTDQRGMGTRGNAEPNQLSQALSGLMSGEGTGGIGQLLRSMPMSQQAARAEQNIKDVYNKSGIGAAAGQAIREIPGYVSSVASPLIKGGVGLVDKATREPARALEQLVTGDVSENPLTIGDIFGSKEDQEAGATTTAPDTTAPDTTTPTAEQKRAQQMDQLQEIDTSGLAGLKKESMTPREVYEGYKSALGSTISRQQSPEELAKERRAAWLGSKTGMRGAAVARTEAAQKARELQGIEKLMGAENVLMGMDADAAKLDVERESNQILNQIRQGQLTTQQMNYIRQTINDITKNVMDNLTFDDTYNRLQTKYQEAMDARNLETAKLAKEEMDRYLNSKLEAYPTYKAVMEEFEQLQSAQTGEFKVRQKSSV